MSVMRTVTIATAAGAVALLAARSLSWGDDKHSATDAPPREGYSSMARFYSGPEMRLGEFSGKLVCLRCDLAPGSGHTEQCAKEGHRHALSMDDGSMIHPLLAGSKEALAAINSPALHGKAVKVHGKYYPSTGVIVADRVVAGQ